MAERVELPRLTMAGVSKRFGATAALDRVDFEVSAGKVHALVGENGAGKSTLMKVLSGAIAADQGTMLLESASFKPRNPLEARRLGVTMIYQELSLAPHLSVQDNVMLGMEPARFGFLKSREARTRIRAALDELGHPELKPEMKVSNLSVASQQVVEIARALAVGCRVLVLDEPTSSLAAADVERLFLVIRRLRERGHAIVYISHFIEEVMAIADRFTVLRDGRAVGGGDVASATPEKIIELMVGRKVDERYPRSARTAQEVVLELKGLSGKKKPESASLKLRRGEVLGISGLVGAGRTELIRAVFGLDPVKSGNVKVGAYSGPASPARRWRQGVGMTSEDRKAEGLAVSMTLADNLTLSRLSGLGPAGLVFPGRQERAARDWISRLDIRCRTPRQRITELSGGNQQKVALARLLYHDVDVLLLDEPTRGIDVVSKAQIYQLIDELAAGDEKSKRKPKAVLMVSSYLPELLGVCDRIAVMCRARLGPARPVAELDEQKIMIEATGQDCAL